MVPCSSCGRLLDSVASTCGHCGAPVATRAEAPAMAFAATSVGADAQGPPSALLRPGQLFDGKYRIERQIGAGGMSVVYLATEVTVDARVVIKALLPHFSCQPGFRERLLREAKALARIDHPNVVGLKSVVSTGPELFLVMEFVEGEDLAVKLDGWKKTQKPPVSAVFSLFNSILDGVEAAHRESIVHRDIKPSNVLVRARDGRVKVTDFGIAKSASDGDHQLTSGMIGTLFYMAPEQLQADPTIDARADVYALGILLYELLTGAVPFHAVSSYEVARQHIQVPFPSLRKHGHDLALDDSAVAMLDVVLNRACAKDRATRYGSCDELRQALAQCTSPLARPAPATLASAPASSAAPSPLAAPPPVSLAPTASAPGPSSRMISKTGAAVVLGGLAVVGSAAAWWFSPAIEKFALQLAPPAHSRGPAPRPTATATATATTTATAAATAPPAASSAGVRCSAADECKATAPKFSVALCQKGSCSYACQQGFFDCGGSCLDLRTDLRHCGSCGGVGTDCTTQPVPLGATARCEEGRCTFACPAGKERCARGCCEPGAPAAPSASAP